MLEENIKYSESFSDFTENSYRSIINLAKSKFVFSRFHDRATSVRHVLWRHDVDFSMHRAAKLAKIENEAGVHATYFLHFHTLFYNVLSRPIIELIHQIIKLGHDIGLHFDPGFYNHSLDKDEFVSRIEFEKQLIEHYIGVSPVAISFHNYGFLENLDYCDEDIICGMVNAYGKTIRRDYGYVSDSNGIWRFRRLYNVLEEAPEEKLHVLTHPEWWTPTVMSPRKRIQRCIDGYAKAIANDYDETLKKCGRPNVL